MSLEIDNIIGTKCYSHFKTEDCNTHNCAANKAMNSDEIVTAETSAKLGGGIREFKYTAVPLKNENGEIVAAFEMFMDETDVKNEAKKMERISAYQTHEAEKLITALQRMAAGDLDFTIAPEPGDEVTGPAREMFDKICKAVNQTVGSVKSLAQDAGELANAAVNGRLDVRADVNKHKGEYAKIMNGFNSTLDSIIKPLNVAAEYVDRISKGDIPPKITDDYNGDFNEIKLNLNTCIDAVNLLIADANILADAAIDGKLQVRAKASNHHGDFRKIIDGVNDTLDAVVEPIKITANTIAQIAEGNLMSKITLDFKGDFAPVKENLNSLMDSLNVFIEEVAAMEDKHVKGDIDYRLNDSKVKGAYVEMYNVVNEVVFHHINAMLDVLNTTKAYAEGDLTKISKRYPGKQAMAHETMDKIRNTMMELTDEFAKLIKATQEGDLQVRGNADKFRGVYKDLMSGLNLALDNVIAPIKLAVEYIEAISNGIIPAKITQEYSGEYQTIKINLNKLIDNLNGLFAQTDKLINAIMQGALQERGDVNAFAGAWKSLVQNLNDIIVGVETPIKELVVILNNIAVNDYSTTIDKDYSGIWNDLKTSTNSTIARLRRMLSIVKDISKGDLQNLKELEKVGRRCENDELVPAFIILMQAIERLSSDVTELVDSAINGELSDRANAKAHSGEYFKIVQGFNDTLDAVIAPIEEASSTLEVMATGDLTVRMVGNYKGDHQNLKESINKLGGSFNQLISKILDGVESTAGAAVQISATSDDIANASQEQSARTEDVASAIEEMSQTINENAGNAMKTAEVAKHNGKVAKDGGLIVEQTVVKMRDIANVVKESASNIEKLGESSRQIGEIISVIDDIADQTNLLALNAAIEAARAGEQGRGFAVVADEVRKLAERTTEATKKIAGMIKNIQKETETAVKVMQNGNDEVSGGIELADKAGVALKDIVLSSQQVLDMISHIASANEQQATTSEEISHNITSISNTANEAARRIQEIAQASEDLSKLTDDLRTLTDSFKTGEDQLKLPVNRNVVAGNNRKYLSE